MRLIGTDSIGQLPDLDLNQWDSISSGSDFDNFPENICCSSSTPIGSSDHMLVKVDISLAVIREPPQCRRDWHFTQADGQGLQVAMKLLDSSPFSTLTDINSSWEFFQRNFLSHADSSHHVFCYPIIPPVHGTLKLVVRLLP